MKFDCGIAMLDLYSKVCPVLFYCLKVYTFFSFIDF